MTSILKTLAFLIFGSVFGLTPSILFAQSWNELSEASAKAYNAGHYDEALRLSHDCVTAASREFGTQHANYFSSIGSVASVMKKKGQYAEARKIEEDNLQSIANSLGTENLTYVTAIKNLGGTCLAMEEFQEAEQYYSQGNEQISKIINKRDEYYNANLIHVFDAYMTIGSELAVLYQHMGRTHDAENLYIGLITFCKSYLDKYYSDYPIYAVLINNLSNVFIEQGKFDEAEPYLKECRELYKAWYGITSPYYLQSTTNLATLYKRTERSAEAEVLLLETLESIRQTQGAGSADYINVLNNLAEIHINDEKYAAAENCLLQALEWQEKNFGREHPMYQTLAHNLAQAYQWMNRYNDADKLYKTVVQKVMRDVAKNFAYLTESEKRSFFVNQSVFVSEYAAFALMRSGALPIAGQPRDQFSKSALGDLYDLQLNFKAILVNATAKMQRNLLSGGDTTLISGFTRWQMLKNEIALQYNLPKDRRENLDSLIQIAEWYESVLSKKSAVFQKGFVNQSIIWQQVQKKLKPGEAAVEFIRFYNGHVYAALIVTPETTEHPQVAIVRSSKTKDLEKEFLSFYKNAIRMNWTDSISYNRFWKPVYDTLKKYSKKIERVYVSPDGIFNQINLNTLQNPVSQKFVIDETEIHLVTNTRDLLLFRNKSKVKRGHAFLMGRPDYGVPDSTAQSRTIFSDLPGTEKEIDQIATLFKKHSWKASVYKATQANESILKKAHNPTVLHLATHGFFIPPANEESHHAYLEAMLQSGIILASANHPLPGNEDGILTAYESMNLDLDSTQLVVLSACETGLGTIEAGEGVYGLQRTLKVAGAQSVMMSLWKVDDNATQALMSLFYKKWLQKAAMRDAFRSAQQELRKKYPQPYYWGAFVMTGE